MSEAGEDRKVPLLTAEPVDDEEARKARRYAGLRRGGGRPKGVPNKTTQSFRQAVEMAAEGLGGVERLIDWAREDAQNERLFWSSIYPKLAPLQVTGEAGGPLEIIVQKITA